MNTITPIPGTRFQMDEQNKKKMENLRKLQKKNDDLRRGKFGEMFKKMIEDGENNGTEIE